MRESAGDPTFALVLAGLGMTSLSMAAPMLPLVRAALADHSVEECRRLADLAQSADEGREARATVGTSSHLPLPANG